MKQESLLRQCRNVLLELSDPDLLLLIQQWVETTTAINDDEAQTVEEQIENLLCLRLGYTVHSREMGKQYPSLTAYLEAEDDGRWSLHPPAPPDLRVRLAGMSLRDFKGIVIACAFSAPRPPSAPSFERPGRGFLAWLVQAIRDNQTLDRQRPQCLFYCFGYQLGLRPAVSSELPDAEMDPLPQLRQVWENYVTGLLLFPETEEELQPLFFTWAARGLRDGQRSLAINAGLAMILLLSKQTPGLALLAPTAAEGDSRAGAHALEQMLPYLTRGGGEGVW